MRKKLLSGLSLAVFCLFSIVIARAEPIQVVTETWEPYNFEKDRKVTGISTDIVETSVERSGVEIAGGKIRIYPWPRAYKIALEQDNVLIYTILRTPERENLFKWIGPIIPSEKFYLFKHRKRDDVVVRSLDDAKKYLIGTLKASIHEDYLLRKGFARTRIQGVANQEFNLKKLLAGRIHFIIDTEASLAIRTKQMNLPLKDFEKSLFLFENDYYMAFSNKTPDETVTKVRNAFFELKKEGEVEKIIGKYY